MGNGDEGGGGGGRERGGTKICPNASGHMTKHGSDLGLHSLRSDYLSKYLGFYGGQSNFSVLSFVLSK